jgi:hypothetical protein
MKIFFSSFFLISFYYYYYYYYYYCSFFVSKDGGGTLSRGSLTAQVKLEANFSFGDEEGKLYLLKQISNKREDGDKDSLMKFANTLVSLGLKQAQWLASPR